ncbi:sodium-dependent noradrenaline transporter-like [Macrobrachium nipponense]|uniref:sodium-dependent noradrenaline transporter-like n=1 Tax=Macrobrachium nipponense TaxID=159736 RepID=UPI0030C7EA0A
MVASSALISIYYAVVLGWTITYLQHSIRKDFTFTPNWTASRPGLIEDNYQKATEFFRNEVVYLKGDKDFEIQPQLVLSLSLTWLLVTVILVRGIRSSSKVMYFTNLIPIAVLLFLLAYSFVTYDWDVWNKSFNLYFSPTQVDASKLLSWEIWADAASQVLFTLGHIFGGAITLASYNDLRQNTLWTALFVILWDTISSFLFGCLVFTSLSKLTSDLNVDIEVMFNTNHTIGTMGVEVIFIAYPAFLAEVKSPIWFVLFFLMILTLGIDSLIGLVETVTTALFDNFTRLRNRYFPNVCAVILVMFLFGLPMCTSSGFYIVECMHSYTCNLSLPLLGISHIVLVCYVFGFDDLMTIIRQELKVIVPKCIEWYLRLALKYVSPVAFCGLVICAARNTEFHALGDHTLPGMYNPLGWILSISPFLLVPAFAIYKYIQLKDKDWHLLLRPTQDFLPAYLREHSNRPDMYILADY